MDDSWDDLTHDFTIDLRELQSRQFVILSYCAQLDPNPYAQAAPDGCSGWYCEVVSEAYLPATKWPIDELYLMAAGWTPPSDPRDNWSRTVDTAEAAASALVDALRHGRQCPDSQVYVWSTRTFPPPDDGPSPEPVLPRGPFSLAA